LIAPQLKIITLSVILFVAGVLHFVTPNLFIKAMPSYLPYHLELIYFTGFLEIIFSFGLLHQRTLQITSKFLALYFLLILPAHFHVSVNKIEMFGIKNPLLLWARTLFQSVFIYWALTCGKVVEKGKDHDR